MAYHAAHGRQISAVAAATHSGQTQAGESFFPATISILTNVITSTCAGSTRHMPTSTALTNGMRV